MLLGSSSHVVLVFSYVRVLSLMYYVDALLFV
jgi:hypothetical protein